MSIVETSMTVPPVVGEQWTGPLPAKLGASSTDGIGRGEEPIDQAAFLRGMVRELGGDPDSAEASTREGIVSVAARRLVADAFVEPMLREAREAAQPTGIFDALERSLQRQVTGLVEPASTGGLESEIFA
jgi:hypothetical protein